MFSLVICRFTCGTQVCCYFSYSGDEFTTVPATIKHNLARIVIILLFSLIPPREPLLDSNVKFTIRYLCAPGSSANDNPSDLLASINEYDPRELAEPLRKLDYSSFLKTPYWAAVVVAKKRSSKWKCDRCGESRELQIHHKDYKCHGLEIINLSKLECLCRLCHALEHKKETWIMPPTLGERKERVWLNQSNPYAPKKQWIKDGKRIRLKPVR